MVRETFCKLFCAFKVKIVRTVRTELNLLALADICTQILIHLQTSWLLGLLIAGSSWPHTFYTQVLLFS